ncbi:TraB/GumN family protein [Sphingomicrobium aestuariivivum]|uniref:TraB/GumN family protein n=1 Tax=Sphingomicrobium aestuariivivum TaxID=1582356 RepID=UPI001FD677FB|nr:TraB/GumN family protein [Sphingomicrobium aestuariivivum]MCJ8190201.1 TraB/GumN family protein [Sphingomicrobium aestuariivivum]
MRLPALAPVATAAAAAALFAASPAAAQADLSLIKAKTNPKGHCFADDVAAPRPALWRVADADSRIYLFGTIHSLPSATCWQDARITRAIADADMLVTEIGPGEPPIFEMIGYVAEAAFDPSNPPLRERLDPRYHPTLDRLLAAQEMPLPESFYDKIDSWALVEGLLDGLLGESAGEEDDSGVEEELEMQFDAMRKPHGALETLRFQVQMSDDYSQELQDAWLDSWFARHEAGPEESVAEWNAMLERWRTGRPLGLQALLATEGPAIVAHHAEAAPGMTEEYLERLLYARNRNWVDWIEARLETPGTVFVAVGAGHLDGDRSVIDYARRRGLPVERID